MEVFRKLHANLQENLQNFRKILKRCWWAFIKNVKIFGQVYAEI